MKHTCHLGLADFLLRSSNYDITGVSLRAFRIGCVEPDFNPLSYIKGSIRSERLRGHNFSSSCRYMERLSRRLENQRFHGPTYYYNLGKLVHYITDAFTHVHNENFNGSLTEHNSYEEELESFFLHFVEKQPRHNFRRQHGLSAFQILAKQHMEYMRSPVGFASDASFALLTAGMVFSQIMTTAFASTPMPTMA